MINYNPAAYFEQYRLGIEQFFASRPLPEDAHAYETELGGTPALELAIDGVSTDGTALWIHGGGYIAGSARVMAAPAAAFARATKLQVISVDYPLAPEHPFPHALDALLLAYRSLLRNVAAERLVVAGESAGGGLLVSLLAAVRDEGLPLPRAAVAFSPATDLTALGESMELQRDLDPILNREGLSLGFTAYAGQRLTEADPLSADLRGFPSLLITCGSHEVLLDDAVRLARRAALVDVDVRLEIAAGKTHGYPIGGPDSPEKTRALRRVGAWVREQLAA